ncbi:MAG: hypothetical protein E7286_10960 [Lachnospiraceae bacterium]|nr:hypothetical protein [Lachnospiraceae bacterium]
MKNRDIVGFSKRTLLTLVSVLFMGISLSVLKLLDLGMDSFTYMNVSIANKAGWSLGNWQLCLNIVMFIPVILWGRKHLGIGTIFNMVLVGYTVDFCTWIWELVDLKAMLDGQVVRYIVMLPVLVVFIFAAAVYMSTDLGTAPFDALPMMISEKISKVSFKVIRFIWDLTAVAIGFVLSGKVPVVTILMVVFLGQTIAFVRKNMKILNKPAHN